MLSIRRRSLWLATSFCSSVRFLLFKEPKRVCVELATWMSLEPTSTTFLHLNYKQIKQVKQLTNECAAKVVFISDIKKRWHGDGQPRWRTWIWITFLAKKHSGIDFGGCAIVKTIWALMSLAQKTVVCLLDVDVPLNIRLLWWHTVKVFGCSPFWISQQSLFTYLITYRVAINYMEWLLWAMAE